MHVGASPLPRLSVRTAAPKHGFQHKQRFSRLKCIMISCPSAGSLNFRFVGSLVLDALRLAKPCLLKTSVQWLSKERLLMSQRRLGRFTVSVGSECSGMCGEVFALRKIGVKTRHVFTTEKDEACRRFLNRTFHVENAYTDITTRDVRKMKKVG